MRERARQPDRTSRNRCDGEIGEFMLGKVRQQCQRRHTFTRLARCRTSRLLRRWKLSRSCGKVEAYNRYRLKFDVLPDM